MRFKKYKRLRKPNLDPTKYLRLSRAEFGHNFTSKSESKKNLDDYYYDDPDNLITYISKFHRVKSENINVGLGADALIKDIFIWHSIKYNQNKRVGFGLPNYFMYVLNSTIFGYKIFNYQIDPSNVKKLDVNFIKRFLKKNKISLLAISNPSHPFEKNWSLDEIEEITKFCKRYNIIFVIDEVYQGLGSTSACSLIKKFQNLIIIRSFSKACGLPGIRVGYTVATKKLSEEIETFRLAIELPKPSINKAISYLKNNQILMKKNSNKIIKARNYAHSQFKKRKLKSYNNFNNSITVDLTSKKNAIKVDDYLKKKKILINYKFSKKCAKYINITTTNINNIKFFFKKFDLIKKGLNFK